MLQVRQNKIMGMLVQMLSILICHTPDRAPLLSRLMDCLNPQIAALSDPGEVEVLVETDPGATNGGMTTGKKRNILLSKCSGKFAAFIDDDDLVKETYVEDILSAVKKDLTVDCVGMKGTITWQGKRPTEFVHSITCKAYAFDGVRYLRTPNHLNPIATRISKRVSFQDITFGEDIKWCFAIKSFLKREVMIEHPIYYYLCQKSG